MYKLIRRLLLLLLVKKKQEKQKSGDTTKTDYTEHYMFFESYRTFIQVTN